MTLRAGRRMIIINPYLAGGQSNLAKPCQTPPSTVENPAKPVAHDPEKADRNSSTFSHIHPESICAVIPPARGSSDTMAETQAPEVGKCIRKDLCAI